MATSDVVPVNEDQLLCPICFEIPEAEVFQCLDGHEICKKCQCKLTECPQCRVSFAASPPIRNRHFERLIESLKVTCSLKGCGKRLLKNLIVEHENICCFDFEKYGNFVQLCNLIGYTSCTSQINNGNTEDIKNHIITTHGCMESKGNEFCLELLDFIQNEIPGQNFWTPIIFNSTNNQCYLLIFGVLNTSKESFGMIAVFLPYSNLSIGHQDNIQLEFTIGSKDGDGDGNVGKHVQAPIPLTKVKELLSSKCVPLQFPFSSLKSHCRNGTNLFIFCKIKQSKEQLLNNLGDHERVEQFVCAKHTSITSSNHENLLRWNYLRRGSTAHELFYQKWANLLDKNGTLETEIVQQVLLLGKNEQNPGLLPEDVKWLCLGVLFLTAQFGKFNDLRLLIHSGVNANVINEKGMTPLHLTMLDKEKGRGLKKAKLLVEKAGARPSVGSFSNQTLLHLSVKFAGPDAVKYFLEGKGIDVNQKDSTGCTPLHLVMENPQKKFQVEIVHLLLQSGVDGTIENLKGETFLRLAMNSGNDNLQKLICTKVLTLEEDKWDSLIPVGNRDSFLPFVRTFVEGPTRLSKKELENLFVEAIINGGVDSLEYLHKRKFKFNKFDDASDPIYFSITMDENQKFALDKIKFLVENNVANLNLVNYQGRNFLHFAAMHMNSEIVQYLLGKGMDVHSLDVNGHTPLFCALENEDEETALEIIKILLENGAKTNIQNDMGLAPLKRAIGLGGRSKDFFDAVVYLFQKYGK